MVKMWMVRAGQEAFLIDDFRDKSIVAIGWRLGDVTNKSPQDIKNIIAYKNPDKKKMQNAKAASQINKFIFNFRKEDYILTYDPSIRRYLLGKIKSDYYYNTDLIRYHGIGDNDYNSIRDVEWLGEVSRDKLKVSTKYTLGAVSTIFGVKGEAQRDVLNNFESKSEDFIIEKINKSSNILKDVPINENKSEELIIEKKEESNEILNENIVEKSLEVIKDKVIELNKHEMSELVAGLLRAMGYKTIISHSEFDKSRNILALSKGLGLEGSVILVKVNNLSITLSDIHSFKEELKNNNKGIYVSTGGFTTEAKYEAERSEIPIILMDLDKFVKFMIQYYDDFDNETRNLIPLTKIYWPL